MTARPPVIGVQNKKQKKTNEIITLLEHFQDLIDKLWKPAKLILLTRIYMTAYLTGLGYRRFNKTLLLSLVYLMLPVSLSCPFLIAPSVYF
jgi:hypothetical protein